jgi:hypothetical protein
MPDNVHFLIDHATTAAPAAREVLDRLQLPHLQALLATLSPLPAVQLPPEAFDTPLERALAQALGLTGGDGRIPWGAWHAARAGLATGEAAWAVLTPCHLQVGMNEVAMTDPATIGLPADQAQALAASMAPYLAEDGITLGPFTDGHWLAHGEPFRDLPTPSPERVLDEDLNPWMPDSALLRRLQNEMQMLLYTHPVNHEREQARQVPVNALWIHGCGAMPTEASRDRTPTPTLLTDLREPARQQDWRAWAAAWQQIDATHGSALAEQQRAGRTVQITLCGASHSQTFTATDRGALARLAARWRRPRLSDLLAAA